MEKIHIIFVFIAGAMAGSFFYALALRFSTGEMAESPGRALFSRSRCPSCGRPIHPLHLVPLAGYLLLRGKCSFCKSRISPLYPAMELLYGFIALGALHLFGLTPYALNIFLLAGLAVSISIIDIKTMTIPDSLIVAFLVLSTYPVILNESLKDSLFGLLLMFIFFLVVLLIFPGSFGGGDVKYASALGLLLGLELSVVALEAALITGAVTGVIYALISGKGLRSHIAFGPFLTAGLIVALVWGKDLVLLYYGWIY